MAGDCCDNACCNCLWRYYSPFVRTSGVVVAGALWAIGITQVSIDLFYIYVIFAAFVVSILELLIFVNPCCDRCCNRENRCFVFWEYMSWLDNWKRAILYLLLSVFCYIKYMNPWAVVAGAILDVLALIYIIRTYRIRPDDEELEGPTPASSSSRSGRTYGGFSNDATATVTTTSEESDKVKPESVKSVKKTKKELDKEKRRMENEARYPGGNAPNPFEDDIGKEKVPDEDMIPEGDAGLMRYPP